MRANRLRLRKTIEALVAAGRLMEPNRWTSTMIGKVITHLKHEENGACPNCQAPGKSQDYCASCGYCNRCGDIHAFGQCPDPKVIEEF